MLYRHILAATLAAFVVFPARAEAPAGFMPGNPTPPGWWPSLHSKDGAWCCEDYDGEDIYWDTTPNGFKILLDGKWVNVPPEAVVGVPNLHGRAVFWGGKLDTGEWYVRCFMPGAGL